MISVAQLTTFLRFHSTPCNPSKLPRLLRDLLPAHSQTPTAVFFAADSRRRLYFEFIDMAGVGHTGTVVHIATGVKAVILFSNRGGTGDIWESIFLPASQIVYVALRSRHGR